VRVRVESNVLGLDRESVVTLDRTATVDAHIAKGYLTPLDVDKDAGE
jgi:hypothetical protein